MKEFEETWSEDVVGHDDTNPAHVVNKATAKRYWMLALKWAKTTHDVISEPRFSCIIREELSGE